MTAQADALVLALVIAGYLCLLLATFGVSSMRRRRRWEDAVRQRRLKKELTRHA